MVRKVVNRLNFHEKYENKALFLEVFGRMKESIRELFRSTFCEKVAIKHRVGKTQAGIEGIVNSATKYRYLVMLS
jgi:hypothetical protein